MKIIKNAIGKVFPKVNTNNLTLETKLAEIEDWDSMNAINLVIELQELSGCKDLDLEIDTETTIGQVAEELREQGVNV